MDSETGTLISRAVTAPGGRPHAEALALEAAGFEAAGRTLYLTLEPCHHWGRTPPCVDAVVRGGVMRVVIGMAEPDPRTAGESIRRLRSAGIEVVLADHAPSQAHHAGHALRHTAARPFVTALLGDLDHAAAWRDMQRIRADAILVDTGAARNGANPVVTTPGLERRTPLRVVFAGVIGADRSLNLVNSFSGYRTAVIAETHAAVAVPASVEVLRVPGFKGRPDLVASLALLAGRGVQNLLLEAGSRLVDGLLEINALDRLAIGSGYIPDRLGDVGLIELAPVGPLRLFGRQPA